MLKKTILTIFYLLISGCNSCEDENITQPLPSVIGCMDANACNYNPNATEAGECNYVDCNGHPINSLWFNAKTDGTWGVGYNSNTEIGGFQITVNGATIISLINGDAQENGFSITFNETNGFIIGFSFSGATIPAGTGELFSLELELFLMSQEIV